MAVRRRGAGRKDCIGPSRIFVLSRRSRCRTVTRPGRAKTAATGSPKPRSPSPESTRSTERCWRGSGVNGRRSKVAKQGLLIESALRQACCQPDQPRGNGRLVGRGMDLAWTPHHPFHPYRSWTLETRVEGGSCWPLPEQLAIRIEPSDGQAEASGSPIPDFSNSASSNTSWPLFMRARESSPFSSTDHCATAATPPVRLGCE